MASQYECSFDPMAPPQLLLTLYEAYQVTVRGVRASTARSKIAAVKSFLRIKPQENTHPQLHAAVSRALKKMAPPRAREMITETQLLQLHAHRAYNTAAPMKVFMRRWLLAASYWFCLRPSEARRLRPVDVTEHNAQVTRKGKSYTYMTIRAEIRHHKSGNQSASQAVVRDINEIPTACLDSIRAFSKLATARKSKILRCRTAPEIEHYLLGHSDTLVSEEEWWDRFAMREKDVVAFIQAHISSANPDNLLDAHSLRHGGACHSFRNLDYSFQELQLLGRWVTEDCVKLYIHSA